MKTKASLCTLALLTSSLASAQVSQIEVEKVVSVYESPGQLLLAPGVISYEDGSGEGAGRFAVSALFDWNWAAYRPIQSPVQYGLELGLIYSHIGASGGNFFGADAPGGTAGSDANLFVFPVTFWGGYQFGHNGRGMASLIVGTHLFYQTNGGAMNLGRDGVAGKSSTEFFPHFAGEVGWTVDRNVALTLRLGWTPAPTDTVFMGSLGVKVPLS